MSADVGLDLLHLSLEGLRDCSAALHRLLLLLEHRCDRFFEPQHDCVVEDGVLELLVLLALCTRQSLYGALSLYYFGLFRLLLEIILLLPLLLLLFQLVLRPIEVDPAEPLGVLQVL